VILIYEDSIMNLLELLTIFYSHKFHLKPVVVTWLHGWPIGTRPQWTPRDLEL